MRHKLRPPVVLELGFPLAPRLAVDVPRTSHAHDVLSEVLVPIDPFHLHAALQLLAHLSPLESRQIGLVDSVTLLGLERSVNLPYPSVFPLQQDEVTVRHGLGQLVVGHPAPALVFGTMVVDVVIYPSRSLGGAGAAD